MPWLKVSDKFAMHPLLMGRLRATPGADDRTTNEVVGFVTRCAAESSGYLTDYYIEVGTAIAVGGETRYKALLRQATDAGLLAKEGTGRTARYRIVEDDELFHIRSREDVMWDRQRDRDRRNPELTMPVLARDGDVCRYCSKVVIWKDTRSGRGGTFDHGNPGEPATVETYFVSCRTCNSKRQDNPSRDVDVPRTPTPTHPYFSPASKTKERLEKYFGRPFVSASRLPDEDNAHPRPGTQPDHAPATTSATPVEQATPPRDTAPSATPSDSGWDTAHPATPAPEWAASPPPDQGPTQTTVEPPWSRGGRPGRDGTGSAGAGRDGTGAPAPHGGAVGDQPSPAPTQRRRRSPRGKRSQQ